MGERTPALQMTVRRAAVVRWVKNPQGQLNPQRERSASKKPTRAPPSRAASRLPVLHGYRARRAWTT